MKKHMMTILLAGAVAMALLAGCGNKTEGEVPPTPTVTQEPTATPVPTETPVPTVTTNAEETKITLGQYKGLVLYEVETSVIAQELVDMMAEYAELVEVYRPAKEGDIVNINYVGKKDGVAFEGGTDDSEEGYNLELGSHSFIDGFEEGLIGATPGEVRDLNLTFPAEYHSAELAGQAVVFTVTVNSVQESVTPELTDAFAKENLGYDTVAEYVTTLYKVRNEESYYEQVTTALMETSTVENYPAALVEKEKQSLIDYYMYYAEMYSAYLGMDTQSALEYIYGFGSQEALESYAEEYAFGVIKELLVLSEVALKENLTISEEEYQNRALLYATSYGYEDVAALEAEYGAEAVFDAITTDYIMDYIISQSIIIPAEGEVTID